jgi:hypothetical protein
MLIAFSIGPLAAELDPGDPAFGAPSPAAVAAVDVRAIEARQDPGWFAGWRSGSLRAIAERDLASVPGALAALDAADRVHLITAVPAEPADLGYLQAAWAWARSLVARGATTVLDVHAMTYRAASAMPAVDAGFDARREVRIVFETSSERPDGAHALHTRGMRKLGAPDLVALCSDADVELVGAVMAQIVIAVAGGAELRTGRPLLELVPSSWQVIDDAHGLAHLLQLNNEARVLVDERGAHLIGVAGKLHHALARPRLPT